MSELRTGEPRTHIKASEAAKRLGHCPRWVIARIEDGQLEGFKHARKDVTVSLESIIAYEERTRMSAGPIVPTAEQSAA